MTNKPTFEYPGDFEWLTDRRAEFYMGGAMTERSNGPKNPVKYVLDPPAFTKPCWSLPLVKAKRPSGDVYGCSWLRATLDRRSLTFVVRRLAEEIRKSALSFEGIAFRGLSGTLVGPMLAVRLRKDMLAIRKDEKQHSTYGVEGVVRGGNYIIVDDLIDTGSTVRATQFALDDHHKHHSTLYEEFPPFNLVGIFLYAGSKPRRTRFKDHVSDRAGLGHVPVFSLHCGGEFEKIQEQRKKQHGKQIHKA